MQVLLEIQAPDADTLKAKRAELIFHLTGLVWLTDPEIMWGERSFTVRLPSANAERVETQIKAAPSLWAFKTERVQEIDDAPPIRNKPFKAKPKVSAIKRANAEPIEGSVRASVIDWKNKEDLRREAERRANSGFERERLRAGGHPDPTQRVTVGESNRDRSDPSGDGGGDDPFGPRAA